MKIGFQRAPYGFVRLANRFDNIPVINIRREISEYKFLEILVAHKLCNKIKGSLDFGRKMVDFSTAVNLWKKIPAEPLSYRCKGAILDDKCAAILLAKQIF